MFTLPELGYDYDALNGHISKAIMELHHSKHHQTYVDKLNAAIEQASELQDKTIEELLRGVADLPEQVRTAIRNNGGGHYNHSQFWKWMSPEGGHQPTGPLADQLNEKYGSFQKFVDEFSTQAANIFGSGWAWLQPDLSIVASPLQDSPLTNSADNPEPILGLDVWEHAYYLDYFNRRPDYIKAWWDVVNWPEVQRRYEKSSR